MQAQAPNQVTDVPAPAPVRLMDTSFDFHDFLNRWRRARIRALVELARLSENADLDETELLASVPSDRHDEALRQIFDVSRTLGLSAARYLGMTWELDDLSDVLGQSGLPCIGGAWLGGSDQTHRVLHRDGCSGGRKIGPLWCDYWREALDGLVMGVGEDERLARHASVGHGDSECVDVLFLDERVRTVPLASEEAGGSSRRYGEIPDAMREILQPIAERLEKSRAKLYLDGFSEGILYYRIESPDGPVCGPGGRLVHESFQRDASKLFQDLRFQDTGPLAVYGSGT